MLKGRKFLISGIILFLGIGYLGYIGFQSSATYYYTVSELIQLGAPIHSENVRVNGQVAPDSIEQETGDLTIRFTIIDGEGSLPVVYQGAVPDAFRAGNDVVIEGFLSPRGIFQANTILTKCPSKYVPED